MKAAPLILLSLLTLSVALAQPPDPAAFDIRTQVPPLGPERMLYEPWPLPEPVLITKDHYLDFILRTYERGRQSAWSSAGSPEARHQQIHARREAFLYRVSGDEDRARVALRFIQGDYLYRTQGPGAEEKTGFNIIGPSLESYLWIRDSRSLTAQDHALCRAWLELIEERAQNFEVGAHNRSQGWATGRKLLTVLFPDSPRNEERLKYANGVWNDWWEHRDTDENAEGYNSHWFKFVTQWLEGAQEEDKYQDPGVKALLYRYLAQATPLGPLPHYGDGCGWNNNPGTWIALFEKWASVYRDGRFRWVAHRIFEHTVAQEQQMWQWGNINNSTMDSLLNAYLWADDTLAPVKPDLGTTLTTRQAGIWSTREERTATGYYLRLTDRVMPDKLIFRTGWDPGSTHIQVELNPPMGHGHSDTAGITSFITQGSHLLTDTPYLVKDHSFHNCFVVKPDPWPQPHRWEGKAIHDSQTITVEDFHAWSDSAYARVHVTGYMAQPVTLERRLFFLGDDGLWVHDTVEAHEAHPAHIGPAWQTLGLYGAYGPNWVNTCLQSLPVAYIWDQRYMMQWLNRPWDLLLYFLPTAGAQLTVDDVTHDNSNSVVSQTLMNNLKYRVWYRQNTELRPGEPLTFSTLLLPHRPQADAGELARSIEVLRDDTAVVIKLRPASGQETWLGLNDAGERLGIGTLATDARRFLLRRDDQGRLTYRVMDARLLGLDGEVLFSSEDRTSAEGP